MKRLSAFLSLLPVLALGVLTGCRQEEPASPDIPAGEVAYRMYSINLSEEDADSKSTITVDPDAVYEIKVMAFDPSTGDILTYGKEAGAALAGKPVTSYVSGGVTSFEWLLPINTRLDIMAVCNYGNITTPATLDDLYESSELVYTISKMSDLNSPGIPMYGALNGVSDDGTGNTFVIPLKRVVAKYTLQINPDLGSNVSSFEITAVRIRNVKKSTTLFGSGEYAKSASDLIDNGDWATASDLSSLNSGGTIEFYMLENCQTSGNGTTTNASYWYDVAMKLTDAEKRLCTYIDIVTNVKFSNGSENEYSCSLFLGKDCKTNFDVKRNTIRRLTATIHIGINYTHNEIIFPDPVEIDQTGTASVKYRYKFEKEDLSDYLQFYMVNVNGTQITSPISVSNVGEASYDPSEGYYEGVLTLVSSNASSSMKFGLCGLAEYGLDRAFAKVPVTVRKAPSVTYDYYLSPTGLSLEAGKTGKFTALRRTYTDGAISATEDYSSKFIWSSNDETVATVGSNGLVTGVGAGSARISATYDGTVLTADVTVTGSAGKTITALQLVYSYLPNTGITTGTGTISLPVDNSISVTSVICYYSDDTNVTLSPSDLDWNSSDTGKVTLTSGSSLKIRGIAAGTSKVTATYEGFSVSVLVTVYDLYVQNINLQSVFVRKETSLSSAYGANVYKVVMNVTMNDGTMYEDVDYSYKVTSAQNGSPIASGSTGNGPIYYYFDTSLSELANYTISINATTASYYFGSDGTKKQWTTGMAIECASFL